MIWVHDSKSTPYGIDYHQLNFYFLLGYQSQKPYHDTALDLDENGGEMKKKKKKREKFSPSKEMKL